MLLCLSLNAQRAPLEVREPYAVLPEELGELGSLLRPHVDEALILSTCNRFEIYVVPRTRLGPECLAGLVARARGADSSVLLQHAQSFRDREAAEHLYRVAAGLESQVLGESQILGQLRRALDAAKENGLAGHRLSRLVHNALAAGRKVREETALGRGALSISRIAVDQATRELGHLDDRAALVVGAGEIAQLAVKALDSIGHLAIVNRTLARAEALAAQHHAEALPWSDLADALAAADVVFCCAGAAQPTITRWLVAQAQARRVSWPLLVVDLALPRSVEPEVAELTGVKVISLEHLRERCSEQLDERLREVPKAEAILAQHLDRGWQMWEAAAAHEAVAALRRRADEVRHDELRAIWRRLEGLSWEERQSIEHLTRAIVNKLLHQPTIWLKEHPARADLALRSIFGIEAVR
ncbi:MAG: glutamyl-tRNA reductase [Chloroflexi bacterium]|nr:glutamyl-tRNA reductase [Chloroflexota bacterium]